MAKVLFIQRDEDQSGFYRPSFILAVTEDLDGTVAGGYDVELSECISGNQKARAGVWVWDGVVEPDEELGGLNLPSATEPGKIRNMKPGETFDCWCVPGLRALLGGE